MSSSLLGNTGALRFAEGDRALPGQNDRFGVQSARVHSQWKKEKVAKANHEKILDELLSLDPTVSDLRIACANESAHGRDDSARKILERLISHPLTTTDVVDSFLFGYSHEIAVDHFDLLWPWFREKDGGSISSDVAVGFLHVAAKYKEKKVSRKIASLRRRRAENVIRVVLKEFPIESAPREVLEAYLQYGPSLRRRVLVRAYMICDISFVREFINRHASDASNRYLLFWACQWILDPQNKERGVVIYDLQCVQRVPAFLVAATKTIFFRHEHVFRDEEMLLSIIDMFEPAPRSQKRTLVALLMAHLDELSFCSIRSMLEDLEVRSIDRGRILNHLSRKDGITAEALYSLRRFYPSWKSGTLRDRQMHRRFFVQIARLRKKEREVAFARAHSPEGRRERLLERLAQCP